MADYHLALKALSIVFNITSICANLEIPLQEPKLCGPVDVEHVCLPLFGARSCPNLL